MINYLYPSYTPTSFIPPPPKEHNSQVKGLRLPPYKTGASLSNAYEFARENVLKLSLIPASIAGINGNPYAPLLILSSAALLHNKKLLGEYLNNMLTKLHNISISGITSRIKNYILDNPLKISTLTIPVWATLGSIMSGNNPYNTLYATSHIPYFAKMIPPNLLMTYDRDSHPKGGIRAKIKGWVNKHRRATVLLLSLATTALGVTLGSYYIGKIYVDITRARAEKEEMEKLEKTVENKVTQNLNEKYNTLVIEKERVELPNAWGNRIYLNEERIPPVPGSNKRVVILRQNFGMNPDFVPDPFQPEISNFTPEEISIMNSEGLDPWITQETERSWYYLLKPSAEAAIEKAVQKATIEGQIVGGAVGGAAAFATTSTIGYKRMRK